MNKRIFILFLIANIFSFSLFAQDAKAKYVFYFIGDGLGPSQRQLSEYFLQEKENNPDLKLEMNSLPSIGVITSHSSDSFVTDSAAGGTALACGHKTKNAYIGKDAKGKNVKNILEAAMEKGWKTGVVTSTRLTHATPACFLAHNINRNNENAIAVDMLNSGVDFLAGGGWEHIFPPSTAGIKSKRADSRNLAKEFEGKGYSVFAGPGSAEEFYSYSPKAGEKVFAAIASSHLPYEIDRINSGKKQPSLADLTQKAVDALKNDNQEFIIMIEGGRIDHACHINDPVGTIYDTLAMDDAVKVATNFYKQYPDETLIVIAADHETGGVSLGFGNNYFLKLKEMKDAKASIEEGLKKYTKKANRTEYFKELEESLGLSRLNTKEKAKLKDAMDMVDGRKVWRVMHGYNPVLVAAAHILSERMNIQWSSYAHTGTQLTVSAIGQGADNFCGFYDNTEVVKKISKATGLEL